MKVLHPRWHVALLINEMKAKEGLVYKQTLWQNNRLHNINDELYKLKMKVNNMS